MNPLIKIGRSFYGIGIAALGIHQLIIKDFRTEILSPFPAWAHKFIAFPIVTGIALLLTGVIISGVFKIKFVDTKKVCLYLGFCFLALFITSHLSYILIFSPDDPLRLEAWFGAAEILAYSGGAFVMAGSFPESRISGSRKNFFTILLEKLIPCGRIFYSVLMILFGWSHFVFTDFVATMVPKWLPFHLFWTYFVGVALISSGIAIIFKIWTRPTAILLAIMLFLFFIFFHVRDAITNPSAGGGKEIVRALVALIFCGIALVIALANDPENRELIGTTQLE
ncbi:MAG: DoxX family membrane protein [Saprospiraceae bacterium]